METKYLNMNIQSAYILLWYFNSFITYFIKKESPFELLQKVWSGIKTFNRTDTDVLNPDPNVHIDKMYKEKYVYIGDKSYMEVRKANRCELITATEEIPNMSYGIGLPNNSLYTKLFSDKYELSYILIWCRLSSFANQMRL